MTAQIIPFPKKPNKDQITDADFDRALEEIRKHVDDMARKMRGK